MARLYKSYSCPEGVYLSIDLDFWAKAAMNQADQTWLLSVLRRAASVRCFRRHDQALAHINSREMAAKGRELWNLDTHSDLAGWGISNPPELNEGTWVDHVKWPQAERFLWIHPDPEAAKASGRGRCEGEYPNPFRTKHPVWPVRRHCTRPRRLQEMDLPSRLIGTCVILSPPWYETKETKAKAVQMFNQIKQQFVV
jgi:hypothetical protein